MKPTNWFQTFIQDAHYGVRSLWRTPVLAGAVVLILALGIGINTAVFTVIDGFFFRARVGNDPDSFIQLVALYTGKFEHQERGWSTSVEDFRAYQARARSVSNLAAWGMVHATMGEDPNPDLDLLVTCNFFALYGLEHAKLGRLFRPDECSDPGGAPVVVISEQMWQRRFAADPQIVGKAITLNRHPFRVVGVVPARFPGQLKSGVWIPWTMQPLLYGQDFFRKSNVPWLTVEGRLKSGFSKAAARAELNIIASQQDRLQPGRKTTLLLTNGSFGQLPAARSTVFWVVLLWMGMVTLVLLLICTNVTTLLLSRAAARREEIAIRLALGAGRTRLVRMLVTESLILASMAGLMGAYFAYRVPDIVAKLAADKPYYPVKPDLVVFAYLSGITLMAACIAGLAPASESLKLDLSTSLKGHENLFGAGARKWRLQDLLVVAQVAFSVTLLVVTGLVVRVQYAMGSADAGFETRQVLLVPLNVQSPPYTKDAARSFCRTLDQHVRALPGVQSVAYASAAPLLEDDEESDAREEVRSPGQVKGTGRKAAVNNVSTSYFETLGIPIIRGRAFGQSDVQKVALVTIVSEAFVRMFWPHEDPIGKTIELAQGQRLEVVGVARDIRSESYGVAPNGPMLYVPHDPDTFGEPLLVRFQGDAGALERSFANAIRDMDRDAIGVPRTLRWMIDDMASRSRDLVVIVLILGILAVLLAVIGIYGVVAFAVTRRTRELGIRMALGATKGEIVRFVFRSGMRSVLVGLAAGSLLALGASQVLAQVLGAAFAPNPWDPIIPVMVAALLATAAVAAMFGPALRAAGSDPMRALRND